MSLVSSHQDTRVFASGGQSAWAELLRAEKPSGSPRAHTRHLRTQNKFPSPSSRRVHVIVNSITSCPCRMIETMAAARPELAWQLECVSHRLLLPSSTKVIFAEQTYHGRNLNLYHYQQGKTTLWKNMRCCSHGITASYFSRALRRNPQL